MTEHDQQTALFDWIDLNVSRLPALAMCFAIPNGAYKSISARMRFKREGLRAGVPDICVAVARGKYHGLFIEMKQPGKSPRPAQWAWLTALKAEGYYTAIFHNWEEAAKLIEWYVRGAE